MSKDRNRVLVVDDDLGMLRAVQRLLRQLDYEPILFSSAQAFKSYTEFEKAACVILDINLNDGSGIELRHHLNDAGVAVPVIYISGNEDLAVRRAALNSGCIAFLNKPFSTQELIEMLKKASTVAIGSVNLTRWGSDWLGSFSAREEMGGPRDRTY
ncbi:response regulator [Bradyrhizobium sp. SRL28]|uniref:response regulator n=1 Tax=Bradyrhizobium sp. SRL28 TaxID=2836178 RepID=UPI001BDF0A98|nr:response regulator [Bradyrhizobium sp. SRL28]MBT1516323.1 response regulator [Bradyrhizobium sp. SRL28]